MGLVIEYEPGQTPLDEDEKEGLLIKAISSRGELDEFEQQNIEKAVLWTLGKRFNKDRLLSENFVLQLHTHMYGDVWAWAGQFRKTNKNIGVDKFSIGMELKILLDDCRYWITHQTYEPDEIAIRFKHRIVSIHCFANGNGRHSRLIADILVEQLFKRPVFSWGAANLSRQTDPRKIYLQAIRTADTGIFEPLIQFARS